ncbi:RRQRL motif-containing zinc-binding protein [Streptomyces lonegramiae]|uniref:RRQRL motif-containing zinc-binding protein n=1 Tax=Streptomyces lonegramiae TaxID=3075524 RepID=A0ABU2XI43_9ACTN|nr:RRQRL motif-containing zinc-binding protein [Streptomyces sp. DSM 41529]MDT0545602.1 RRQRL motif-containing zinc-binding protein [Streptomyces sp. DSM 41529]
MSPAFGKCYDPSGARYGIPTYPWQLAPDGYATRRQLRARGLRPGGQSAQTQIMRANRRAGGFQVAYLYRLDLAKPVRPMTPAMWRAHEAMMLARRTCPACRMDAGYCIPTSLGMCVSCAFPEEQRAA